MGELNSIKILLFMVKKLSLAYLTNPSIVAILGCDSHNQPSQLGSENPDKGLRPV